MNYHHRANREDLKVGTLVRAYHGHILRERSPTYTGIITSVEESEDLFSEKYAVMETNTLVHVLCDGVIKYFDFDEDSIEVINESRRSGKSCRKW